MADERDPALRFRERQALNVLEALWKIGEDLAAQVVARAPIEEGHLRASAAVVLIINGSRFEGEGAYAGAQAVVRSLVRAHAPIRMDVEVSANTVYAARQHEELTWRHPLGGEAKFLERPLAERLPRYEAIIEKAARRGL